MKKLPLSRYHRMLPVLAWAQLDLGRVEHATALIEQALLRTRREGLRLILVEALRVRARIALRAGRWSDAACSLEEGVAAAREIAYPDHHPSTEKEGRGDLCGPSALRREVG